MARRSSGNLPARLNSGARGVRSGQSSMKSNPSELPTWKKWAIAARLFALPASLVPVCLGTAAAVTLGHAELRYLPFVGALLAMALLHTAANMLSDVSDFRRGLDTVPTPVSGAIVRGLLNPGSVRSGAWLLFVLGAGLGLALVPAVGPGLLVVGFAGIAIGLLYSALKAKALGDLAVLMNFGLLATLGAWMVQTRSASWAPVLWSIPVGLHVIGILHANNWRDRASDPAAGLKTVASLLGDRGSSVYLHLLILLPYILVTGFICPVFARDMEIPRLPISVLAVWLSIPLALKVLGRARSRSAPKKPFDFIALDGAVAQLSLAFGVLYILGVLGAKWVQADLS